MNIYQKDYYRLYGKKEKRPLLKGFLIPSYKFVYFFRKATKHKNTPLLGLIYKTILYHYQIKFGYQIYAGTQIGEGLYFGHWGAVIINPEVIIGKNCNIAQGVTIGQTNRGDSKGCPIIGDEVWIGANAVIIGKIKIGNNVLIAPNSYLTKNVPDNSIVVGNPARILPSEHATKGYINHKV